MEETHYKWWSILQWQKAKADATGDDVIGKLPLYVNAKLILGMHAPSMAFAPWLVLPTSDHLHKVPAIWAWLALNFPDPNPFSLDSRHALDKALMRLFKASQAQVLSCQLLVVPVLFLIDWVIIIITTMSSHLAFDLNQFMSIVLQQSLTNMYVVGSMCMIQMHKNWWIAKAFSFESSTTLLLWFSSMSCAKTVIEM